MRIDITKIASHFSPRLQSIIDQLSKTHDINEHILVWKDYMESDTKGFTEDDWLFHIELLGLEYYYYPFEKYKDNNNSERYEANPFAAILLSQYKIRDIFSRDRIVERYENFVNSIDESVILGIIKMENVEDFATELNWNSIAKQLIKIDRHSSNYPTVIQIFQEMQKHLFVIYQSRAYHNVSTESLWILLNLGLRLESEFYNYMLVDGIVLLYYDDFLRQVKEYLEDGTINSEIELWITSDDGRKNIVDFLENIKNNKPLNTLIRLK